MSSLGRFLASLRNGNTTTLPARNATTGHITILHGEDVVQRMKAHYDHRRRSFTFVSEGDAMISEFEDTARNFGSITGNFRANPIKGRATRGRVTTTATFVAEGEAKLGGSVSRLTALGQIRILVIED